MLLLAHLLSQSREWKGYEIVPNNRQPRIRKSKLKPSANLPKYVFHETRSICIGENEQIEM